MENGIDDVDPRLYGRGNPLALAAVRLDDSGDRVDQEEEVLHGRRVFEDKWDAKRVSSRRSRKSDEEQVYGKKKPRKRTPCTEPDDNREDGTFSRGRKRAS